MKPLRIPTLDDMLENDEVYGFHTNHIPEYATDKIISILFWTTIITQIEGEQWKMNVN